MPGHTANKCHTIRCIVQDLIDSGKLEDLEKILSVKTSLHLNTKTYLISKINQHSLTTQPYHNHPK